MNNKEKSFWDKKYISICSLLILATAIFGPTYWINFHEIPDLKKQISELSIESKNIEITEKEEKLFQRRFENLESKYIDVLASKDTINFWLAVIGILIPFTLGYTIYQKGKTMEMAENEMKEIRKIREKLQKDTEKDKKELKELKDQLSLEMNQLKDQLSLEMNQLKDQLSLEMNQLIEDKVKQAIQNIDDESDKQREINEYFNRSYILYEDKKYKEAIEYINKALALDDKNIYGLNVKAVLLMKLGKYEEATEYINKALKIDENNTSALYNRACANSLLNNKEKSFQDLDKVFELNYFEDKENREDFYKDADFDNIRKTKEFKEFEQKVKKKYGDK